MNKKGKSDFFPEFHDISLQFWYIYIFIYIYAFSRRFYPKLYIYSGYTYFCQYVCSLGIKPTTFALLTQCSTTEPQEHAIVRYKFAIAKYELEIVRYKVRIVAILRKYLSFINWTYN